MGRFGENPVWYKNSDAKKALLDFVVKVKSIIIFENRFFVENGVFPVAPRVGGE